MHFFQINCLNARQNLTEKEDLKIDFLCQKRLSYVPIQYVIEEWDFFDLTLKMQQPVFIPRSETHVSSHFVFLFHDNTAMF